MCYLKLFMNVILVMMVGCGGGSDDTNSNSTKTDNSTTNEWRLVKNEIDEGKNGSVDRTLTYSYNIYGKLERSDLEYMLEDRQVTAIVYFNHNAEGQWTTMKLDATVLGYDSTINAISNFSYGIDGKLTEEQVDFFNDASVDVRTTYFYNFDGKLESTYSYNELGALEDITTYIYDISGRMIKTEMDTSGNGLIDDKTIYSYDSNGNLIKSEDNNSITYYTWEIGKFSIGKGIPIEWFLG